LGDLNRADDPIGEAGQAASRELSRLTTADKNACLLAMADALEKNAGPIKDANAQDMEVGAKMGLTSALLDRLKLDDKRIASVRRGCAKWSRCPIPLGGCWMSVFVRTG
jgi:glutamate-5-semialdehyde dehydrogenase